MTNTNVLALLLSPHCFNLALANCGLSKSSLYSQFLYSRLTKMICTSYMVEENQKKNHTLCPLKTIWNSDSGVHKSGCIYSCTYCLWLLAFAYRGRAKSLWQRMYGPGSSKYCLSVPIQKHSPSGGLGSMGEWLYPSCGVSSPSSRLEVTLVVV